jgi:Raf kinase inhibitor-like YbhB/YbcL family protein
LSVALLALALLVAVAACGGSTAAPSPKPALSSGVAHITVSSPDLPGRIPMQFTCDGAGTAPRIQWTSAQAKEWALEVLDPDAPGATFVHWLVYDLPGAASSVGPELPPGAVQGRNSRGQNAYTPPCPPLGPVHHYHFVVSALDATLGLSAGASRSELEAKMRGHVVAQGELVATYQRAT